MLKKPVILVVEDHPLIRLSALDIVNTAGFAGIGAENADDAIRILEARADIRLVFTDVEMPGTMDGVKLAHYIRNRWPPVHLVIVSGKSVLAESQLPVGSRFLSKPYSDSAIAAELHRLLGISTDGASDLSL